MLKKSFALLVGAVLLVLGILFSVVLLAAVVVLGLGVWAYLYWKTRKLRGRAPQAASGGHVIDGEAVVVEERHVVVENVLPREPTPGEPK